MHVWIEGGEGVIGFYQASINILLVGSLNLERVLHAPTLQPASQLFLVADHLSQVAEQAVHTSQP